MNPRTRTVTPPGGHGLARRLGPAATLAAILAVAFLAPGLCSPAGLPASAPVPGLSPASHPGYRDTLRLATGSVGGTFLPVGRELADWWNAQLTDVVVVVDTTAGSVENLDRLVNGEADLAIVGESPFREVVEGRRTFSDQARRICTLGSLYDDAEQYVARASLVRVGNILDLNGLLMYPGPHNSGGEIDTRLILSTLGIEPRYVYVDERDKGYSAAAEALARGDFDAATFSGGVPIQAVTDLFREHPGEFVILPFSRHMLNKLRYYQPDFEGVMIHPAAYPGLDGEVPTVGGPNLLVACPRLDPAVAAELDRAVRRGIAEPGKGLRASTSHPVLQVLDRARWAEVPETARCVTGESAGLDPSAADPRP